MKNPPKLPKEKINSAGFLKTTELMNKILRDAGFNKQRMVVCVDGKNDSNLIGESHKIHSMCISF